MPVGTPVTLGSSQTTSDLTAYTHTTTASVPSGGKVILACFWINETTATTITVTGGSLSWVEDTANPVAYSTVQTGCSIWSADAPSGLASSTVLTVTHSSNVTCHGQITGAAYVEGVSTGDTVEDTDGNSTTGSGTTWTSQTLTLASSDGVMFTAAAHDNNNNTNQTTDSPGIELWDNRNANNFGVALSYLELDASGNYAMSGDFNISVVFARITSSAIYGDGGEPPPSVIPTLNTVVTGPRLV